MDNDSLHFGRSIVFEASGSKPLWEEGPPPPPAPEVMIGDPSCQGVLRLSLEAALHEIFDEMADGNEVGVTGRSTQAGNDDVSPQSKSSRDRADDDIPAEEEKPFQKNSVRSMFRHTGAARQEIIGNIGRSFADAVTESQAATANSHKNSSAHKSAPSAVLRGRLDHYNRRNQKWRFVVNETKIKCREPLIKERRKMERPSLWYALEDRHWERYQGPTNAEKEATAVALGQLEILAYNDIS